MIKFFRLFSFLGLFAILLAFAPLSEAPYPHSLLVTQSGFRDDYNQLKCRFFYMTTVAGEMDNIEKAELKLEVVKDGESTLIKKVLVPLEYNTAVKTEGVVSFYTTSNIVYIGIGDFDLFRQYRCAIRFMDSNGEYSKSATFSKVQ
jgi:hypothetical protein